MSFTYEPHITSQVLVASDKDKVVAALQIPEGGRLNNFSGRVDVIAGQDTSILKAVVWSLHGFMIPIPDPDGSLTPDQIWDLNVVKDAALVITAGSSELEVDTLDTEDESNVDELGVPALQKIMDDWGPVQLMRPHVKMLTVADTIGGFKDATPDTWLPRDSKGFKGGRGWSVDQPSMALFALGAPLLTATATAWFEADTTAEWAQLQYLEYVLEQAFIEVIGLTETGAESPWADAATVLVNQLITFFEEITGSFFSVAWTGFTMFRASVTVPGTFSKPSLNLGW